MASHLDAAYNLACWMLHDPNDAEDAVQEASIRAYKAIDGARTDAGKAWFLAIVRNACLNSVRAYRYRTQMETELNDSTEQLACSCSNPEERLMANLNLEACQAAIASLPAPLREVLVLREFEDMSYREIGDVIGCPIGTVMSRLARARERLISSLSNLEER